MTGPKSYRLLNADVTAIVWTGSNVSEMREFAGEAFLHDPSLPPDDAASIQVKPDRLLREIYPTDVLVKYADGTFTVMIPEHFERMYAAATS
jgi:hypothetical protein